MIPRSSTSISSGRSARVTSLIRQFLEIAPDGIGSPCPANVARDVWARAIERRVRELLKELHADLAGRCIGAICAGLHLSDLPRQSPFAPLEIDCAALLGNISDILRPRPDLDDATRFCEAVRRSGDVLRSYRALERGLDAALGDVQVETAPVRFTPHDEIDRPRA